MSASRFRQILLLTVGFGASVVTGSKTDGALPDSARGQPAMATSQIDARASDAYAAAETLAFEIYQDKTMEHRWRLNKKSATSKLARPAN